jgi:hypothetical protein
MLSGEKLGLLSKPGYVVRGTAVRMGSEGLVIAYQKTATVLAGNHTADQWPRSIYRKNVTPAPAMLFECVKGYEMGFRHTGLVSP